jgi:hypothetical protein
MPRRLSLLLTSLAVVAAADAALAQSPRTVRPNIVFIVADDLGWTDLGVYGSNHYETPRIDRLASQGMRFTEAYANPNCAPTRAATATSPATPPVLRRAGTSARTTTPNWRMARRAST